MAERFKIYLNFLPPDEIDEAENDFRADFLFAKWKARPNYLIFLQCFTTSKAGFPIPIDIFLFLMVKLLPELLKKN